MAVPPQPPFQFEAQTLQAMVAVPKSSTPLHPADQIRSAPLTTISSSTTASPPSSSSSSSSKKGSTGSFSIATSGDPSAAHSKKQKTTPPCDRCRQRRIKCDRLEPTCSSCIKYKAVCVRTPNQSSLYPNSMDAMGNSNQYGALRCQGPTKRDRTLSEAEILDSCLRDVQMLQMNRLRRIEQFFDRLGIDEQRLEEIGWLTDQLKVSQETQLANGAIDSQLQAQLGPSVPQPWATRLQPLLMAAKRLPPPPAKSLTTIASETPAGNTPKKQTREPKTAKLTNAAEFLLPASASIPYPSKVPLSLLNRSMFELSVYDQTEYLGPVAGSRAKSWDEEMRFHIPWMIPEPQVREELLVLPPLDEMLDLIRWMVQSPLYTYFPILTKASILNALSSAVPGPVSVPELGDQPEHAPRRGISGRVSAILLLNAIFALGAAYRASAKKGNNDPKSPCDGYDEVGQDTPHNGEQCEYKIYHDRGRALTVYVLDQPRISSLQALLLLMKCPAIPGIQNLYREQACAMALALGLHRDCESWTMSRSVCQLRRNIFWCCYVADASHSLNAGSPERFQDEYITVGLPQLPSTSLGDDMGELEIEKETQRIAFLIEQAKLWRIVKKIRACGQASSHGIPGREGVFTYQSAGQERLAGDAAMSARGGQPAWVWRADSVRRIHDVELAKWQMELPAKLRFDYALSRRNDACPFLLRMNGLAAMLQLIFNEVLILLHHPFLILAESRNQQAPQRQYSMDGDSMSLNSPTFSGRRPPSSKSSRSSFSGSSRGHSRRSSSISRGTGLSGVLEFAPNGGPNSGQVPASGDQQVVNRRNFSPFLNSCTKAAEAITFLLDHVLRTAPEWLVCHNETETAIHMAERVHMLNVKLSKDSSTMPPSIYSSPGTHAKAQLKLTRSFRREIEQLDPFTMSNTFRRGLDRSALGRTMEAIRLLLSCRVAQDRYRIPRTAPTADSETNACNYKDFGEEGAPVEQEGVKHFLQVRLGVAENSVWIRYRNVLVDEVNGLEKWNGEESWMEILEPYDPESKSDVEETLDEDVIFESEPLAEEPSMAVDTEGNADEQMCPALLKDFASKRDSAGSEDALSLAHGTSSNTAAGTKEQLYPHQVSSSALLEMFVDPNPANLINFTDLVSGAPYYPKQRNAMSEMEFVKDFGNVEAGYDVPFFLNGSYQTQPFSLESQRGFDVLQPAMNLDGTLSSPTTSNGPTVQPMFTPAYDPAQRQQPQQQQHQQQQQSSAEMHIFGQHTQGQGIHHRPTQESPLVAIPAKQQQQPSQSNLDYYQAFGLGATGLDLAQGSGQFEGSQLASNTGSPLAVGPMAVTNNSLTALTENNFLEMSQTNNFSGDPTHQQAFFGAQTSQAQPVVSKPQQSQNPAIPTTQPFHRPFYGMPMGGFMSSSIPTGSSTLTAPSTPTWSFMGQASDAPSPISSVPSSTPTSPLTQATYRMVLSPSAAERQSSVSRLHSWAGVAMDQELQSQTFDLLPPTSEAAAQQRHQQQQQQRQQRQQPESAGLSGLGFGASSTAEYPASSIPAFAGQFTAAEWSSLQQPNGHHSLSIHPLQASQPTLGSAEGTPSSRSSETDVSLGSVQPSLSSSTSPSSDSDLGLRLTPKQEPMDGVEEKARLFSNQGHSFQQHHHHHHQPQPQHLQQQQPARQYSNVDVVLGSLSDGNDGDKYERYGVRETVVAPASNSGGGGGDSAAVKVTKHGPQPQEQSQPQPVQMARRLIVLRPSSPCLTARPGMDDNGIDIPILEGSPEIDDPHLGSPAIDNTTMMMVLDGQNASKSVLRGRHDSSRPAGLLWRR
ncbi:hypothetical protein BGZ73_006642 [Actinomortierella ambigua]|nr:hypothetical protein BGZ73_006642 [Actinomortierella ambigua]